MGKGGKRVTRIISWERGNKGSLTRGLGNALFDDWGGRDYSRRESNVEGKKSWKGVGGCWGPVSARVHENSEWDGKGGYGKKS